MIESWAANVIAEAITMYRGLLTVVRTDDTGTNVAIVPKINDPRVVSFVITAAVIVIKTKFHHGEHDDGMDLLDALCDYSAETAATMDSAWLGMTDDDAKASWIRHGVDPTSVDECFAKYATEQAVHAATADLPPPISEAEIETLWAQAHHEQDPPIGD